MRTRTTVATALVATLASLATLLALLALAPAGSATTAVGHPTQDRCRAGRVALTFDDGPSPTVTPDLVRLLRRLDVPATFFMVGWRVQTWPEVARLVSDAGFAVGNHTWDHTDLTTLDRRGIHDQLRRTRLALARAGVRPTRLVRPPYGSADARVRRQLADRGWTPVFWTVDPRDWDGRSAAGIRRGTVAAVEARGRRDSVVLHHDGVANARATLAALPGEVGRLRAQGFCFTTLAEVAPGTW